MRACRKIALCAALFVLSAFILLPADLEAASPNVDIYVAEGTFESLEDTEYGLVITLDVRGQKASGPVSASCKYYDHNGEEVSRQFFSSAFLGEPITVEIPGRDGEVYACHAARFFYTN